MMMVKCSTEMCTCVTRKYPRGSHASQLTDSSKSWLIGLPDFSLTCHLERLGTVKLLATCRQMLVEYVLTLY
jgi:hypothetical protein